MSELAKSGVAAARKYVKKKKVNLPRVISILKFSGVLPLMPIFTGRSSLGALSDGIVNGVKIIKDLNNGKKVQLGKGQHLEPYKNG